MSAKTPMTPEDASRIQSSTDKKQSQDQSATDGFKERAQSAANQQQNLKVEDREPSLGNGKSKAPTG